MPASSFGRTNAPTALITKRAVTIEPVDSSVWDKILFICRRVRVAD
jgi:hypothetical protein